jgi:hypothetical protein
MFIWLKTRSQAALDQGNESIVKAKVTRSANGLLLPASLKLFTSNQNCIADSVFSHF